MTKRCEVPFFNYPALFKAREDEYMNVLRDVLSRGAYILQKDMEEFEDNLEEFLGVKYALGVADGTNALILALLAVSIGPGDEVILPSHTYVASAASIHYVGAKPVLVECQYDHMIDPVAVRQAVTAKTRAIMPVQLNGRTASMDAICAIAEEYDLVIIEDAAQALGSRFKGRAAGSFGIAGTFSFYPAKLLGCFGDGGAVITNDDEMAKKIFLLRDHGRDKNGEVVTWGTNCRLDNVQAAILNLKLKTYEQDIHRRREIAALYQDGLGEVEHLVLPPAPDSDSDHFDVYQNYEIEADRRDELQCYLKEHGIGTIVQFGGKAVHQYPLGFEGVSLPYTEQLYKRALLLPMHTALSNDDVDYVCDSVNEFYS
ncbi:MAG: DegT/DnrJ/EryC1/StrS family aminotransferase [Candidatus Scalindua rubra]|uniref:Pleiotrophic regulatory protein DegT n=1 Tax=Candidatus Scalindua brodae TaxID=237368 RepID=A0A0B0EQ73_9BACT|nr:MAG: pleiotrophic regulatory protein DegT [Candidatus Scalindua brodae]MBZ0108987.1 DegT/DnrJ/EryC1/StrS family aminotransferase [Candidatus Scalindua rubra]